LRSTVAKATQVCTFYDPRKAIIVEARVQIDTGLGARMIAVRNAASDHAADNKYPVFAIPSTVETDAGEKWLVFRMQGRMASFLKAWPNRASAEMWMQHNGDT